MQARKFEHFLKELSAPTRRQRERLLGLLLPAASADRAVDLIEQATAHHLTCAGCGAHRFHKHGRANGLQRYRCRACGRTCNGLTGTPLARLRHKGRWLDYLDGMLDSHSIRRTAGHFAREAGITHEAVNLKAGVRVRGAIHVQNVNAYHSRLRGWLQPFRGVASRYLGNYLGWRWALDGGRVKTPEALLRAALGIFHT
jgi:transposase-like protein